MVAENLELDVARRLDVLLDVDVTDAERRFGLALRRLDRVRQLAGRTHDAHTASAAARGRLHDHRVADVLRELERLLLALDRAVAAGQDRDARFLHHAPRPRLVAHQPDDLRIRTDELDVARFADFGEVRALGKESVAGMDRVRAGNLGGADHRRDVQIAVGAARRADPDILVGEADVQRVLVGFRIDCDGLDAQLAAGVDDANRDFSAVGDENFLKHLCLIRGPLPPGHALRGPPRAPLRYRVLIAKRRSAYCTGCPFST